MMSFFLFLQGQNQHHVFSSSGNHFVNSTINVSWTIGEVFTESLFKSEYALNLGFQQNLTKIESGLIEHNNLSLRLYPNPIVEKLTVETNNLFESGSSWLLVDLQGRAILSDLISETIFTIDFDNLTSGIYFLKIISPDKRLSSINKITKI